MLQWKPSLPIAGNALEASLHRPNGIAVNPADRAIAQYEKVLALDPDHATARSRLAQLREGA